MSRFKPYQKQNTANTSDYINGDNNWTKFKVMVKNFDVIYVDSDFTIDIDSTGDINHDIEIIGRGGTITIVSTSNTRHCFRISSRDLNIKFFGVKIILNFSGFFISGDGSDGYQTIDINSISIMQCNISGYGLFCYFSIQGNESEPTIPQDTNQVWVRKTVISDNTIHDLPSGYYIHKANYPTSYTSCGLFIISQVSVESILIEHNTLLECGHTVFQMKNRNTNNTRKEIILRHNALVNSDACWGGFLQNYTYYVFGIIEADTVIYEYNHVEGLKIKETTHGGYGAALYDIYTKAEHYFYRNNVSKNNFAFYITKDIDPTSKNDNLNYLLKCKSCYNILAEYNKFILEEDFLTRNSEDNNITNQYVILSDVSSGVEPDGVGLTKWTYRDNTVRVPRLKFEAEQNTRMFYEFKDNDIVCDYLKGYIIRTGSNPYPYRSMIKNRITSLYTESLFGITTGLTNTYVVTLDPAPSSYTDGMMVTIKPNTSNTGASTLNCNELGAKSLRDTDGTIFTSGKLSSTYSYTFRYNASLNYFLLQSLDSFRIYYGVGNPPYASVPGTRFVVKDNIISVPNFHPASYGSNHANAINYIEFEEFICEDNIFPSKFDMSSCYSNIVVKDNTYRTPVSTFRYGAEYINPYVTVKEKVPVNSNVVVIMLGTIDETADVSVWVNLKLIDTSGLESIFSGIIKHTPTEITINNTNNTTTNDANLTITSGEFAINVRHLSYDSLRVTVTNANSRNYVSASIDVVSMPN